MTCPNGCRAPLSPAEAAAREADATPWRSLAASLAALAEAAAVFLPNRAFDPYLVSWAAEAKTRLEHIAEVIGEDEACAVAGQIAAALLFVARRPDLARSIVPAGIRHDAACLAADLAEGVRTIAREKVELPIVPDTGPNEIPGAPGQAFDLRTGEPRAAPSLAPLPARQIVASARQGDPNARRFVAGVIARSGVDETYARAAASLARAATLATRSEFVRHYTSVATLGGMR